MSRRAASDHVGVNVRTARDWDKGIRKIGDSRLYPDGRRVDYNTGMTSVVEVPVLVSVEAVLHPRVKPLGVV